MEEKPTKKELKAQRHEEKLIEEKKEKFRQNIKNLALFIGIPLVVIASVIGLVLISGSNTPPSSSSIKAPPITSKDITMGNKNAKVTLIEYADFQCPACAAYYPLVKRLTSKFDNKILFAYRFFPLTQLHQNAMLSAEAAYAANKQGKFWQMHDLLFANQTSWADSNNAEAIFTGYAKKLGLNLNKFQKDMNSGEAKVFINNEENIGTAIGVNSTPTFFLNGTEIQNPRSYSDFKNLIEQKLK